VTRLYFARHSESDANLQRVFANRGDGPPLTSRGRQQASTLAGQLSGQGIQHLYASPLLRARQTAEILAHRLAIPCTTSEALREYDVGRFEGTAAEDGWQAYEQTLRDWLLHQYPDRRTGGGESFTDIEHRFVPFIEGLRRQPETGTYLLVSHGGLFQAMLPRVLANVSYPFSHRHVLGHIAVVVAEDDHGALECRQWDGRLVSPGTHLAE
jgi:2,3-bisphosphoglycerate-dependent phosphoglycerate mutase